MFRELWDNYGFVNKQKKAVSPVIANFIKGSK